MLSEGIAIYHGRVLKKSVSVISIKTLNPNFPEVRSKWDFLDGPSG